MNPPGDADLLVAARSALLDALDALVDLHDAVVVIGAQAVYLHTGAACCRIGRGHQGQRPRPRSATARGRPLVEQVMADAGFALDPTSRQPGAWLNPHGIPVDLMVPEALSGSGGRRGARIPPHSSSAARRATGLEAAMVDRAPMLIRALDVQDERTFTASVAGPAALLVAKLHKLAERRDTPDRLNDKDAHDVYRLLVAIDTPALATPVRALVHDQLAGPVTAAALTYLDDLFAAGPDALGSRMAGRAERLVGAPATVAASAAELAHDLVTALR